MKPKLPSILDRTHVVLPFVSLYSSDLDHVLELATERGFEYKLSDLENEYESLADLAEHCGIKIRNLSIEFRKVGDGFTVLRITLKSSRVVISAARDDDYAALEQRIVAYLRKRAPWFAPVLNSNYWFTAILILAPFVLMLKRAEHPTLWDCLAAVDLVVIAMMAVSTFFPRLFGGVYLQRKHEVVSFWTKYEKVLIAVITAILTLAGKWMFENGAPFH